MRILYLFTITFLILGFGVGYFLIYPAYALSTTRTKELTALSSELVTLRKTRDLLKKLASQPLLKQRTAQAKSFIPVAEEREVFTSQLDALAKEVGVNLTTLNFKEVSIKKNNSQEQTTKDEPKKVTQQAKPLGFSLTISGSYARVQDMIGKLTHQTRYAILTSTVVRSDDAGASSLIEGLIFTLPEPKDKPKLDLSIENWEYLNRSVVPVTAPQTGRPDPFAGY